MVHVQLQRDWKDSDGVVHMAGDTVDVDVSTLARLESEGRVAESPGSQEEESRIGGGGPTTDPTSWVGPTSGTDT